MRLEFQIIAALVGIILSITIVSVSAYAIHSNEILWRDHAIVTDLHLYPVTGTLGEQYQERMVLQSENHGNIPFDTANMCSPEPIQLIPAQCGAGSVGWDNGTRVFIWALHDGLYVGAIQR
jgi:hypothetical protein